VAQLFESEKREALKHPTHIGIEYEGETHIKELNIKYESTRFLEFEYRTYFLEFKKIASIFVS
jgi:hypothetical protein